MHRRFGAGQVDEMEDKGERRNKMTGNERVIESREVGGFDRVVLSVHNMMNEIEITQGEHESLTIEAQAEILPKITSTVCGGQLVIQLDGSLLDKLRFALATSFTRQVVRYYLTVKNLAYLELVGFAHAELPELYAGSLGLKLTGAGGMTIGSLAARQVNVDLHGACRIKLSGQVEGQDVKIRGPGLYEALDLKSRRAFVSLKELGWARVWVVDRLGVKVRGLGRVEVRGTPEIKEDISPRAPQPGFVPQESRVSFVEPSA